MAAARRDPHTQRDCSPRALAARTAAPAAIIIHTARAAFPSTVSLAKEHARQSDTGRTAGGAPRRLTAVSAPPAAPARASPRVLARVPRAGAHRPRDPPPPRVVDRFGKARAALRLLAQFRHKHRNSPVPC